VSTFASRADPVDNAIRCRRTGSIHCPLESLVAVSIVNFHVLAASNKGPSVFIMNISGGKALLAQLILDGLFTPIVGDDAAKLTKLFLGYFTFIVQPSHVSPQVVVTVVDAFTGVKVDVNVDDFAVKGIGEGVVGNLDGFGEHNLGAVRAADGGHLLDATTHGSARNILDIPSNVHVIIHAHVKEVVALVPIGCVIDIIRPSQSMAVDGALSVVVVSRKDIQPLVASKLIRGRSTASIHEAKICIVRRILVHTVHIVRLGAVAIVVVRLPVFRPAAHGSASSTRGHPLGIDHRALKVG